MKKVFITVLTALSMLTISAQQGITTHKVEKGQTLYGIAKKYQVSINQIYALNAGLKDKGLQAGQTIVVKETGEKSTSAIAQNTTQITHYVQPKETLYGIAKEYKVSINQIYALNAGLKDKGLQAGETIIIKEGKPAPAQPQAKKAQPEENNVLNNAKTIIVDAGDTLYKLAQTYGVSVNELYEWNPKVSEAGLQEGMRIVVGKPEVQQALELKKIENKVIQARQRRNLVMLLPFNIENINLKDKKDINQKLTSNVLLNIALDFYSGALLALEEAEIKDLPINVKIIDSKENTRSIDIDRLKQSFDMDTTDVIIGPFFQKNVDALSKEVSGSNTIVVSPISTEKQTFSQNQVNTMPDGEILAQTMFQYLNTKDANIIYTFDKSGNKGKYSEYLRNAHKLLVDGKETMQKLEELLTKDKKNFVVFDIDQVSAAVDFVNTLVKLSKKYPVQLVALEKDKVLESSSISVQHLADLNLLFPSVSFDADNNIKYNAFEHIYRKKYDSNPNRYAIRGYDVTKDIIMRMTSDEEDIFAIDTEQIENKFSYKRKNGGVYNEAVYILYYDKKLLIKRAE